MQICQLTAAECEKVLAGLVPDCHNHSHISKRDAHLLAESGRVRFITERAVVQVCHSPLLHYWYDRAVQRDDHRHLGTARSGPVRVRQLLNFMSRGMKHKVREIAACGAHGRLMSVQAVNSEQARTVDFSTMAPQEFRRVVQKMRPTSTIAESRELDGPGSVAEEAMVAEASTILEIAPVAVYLAIAVRHYDSALHDKVRRDEISLRDAVRVVVEALSAKEAEGHGVSL